MRGRSRRIRNENVGDDERRTKKRIRMMVIALFRRKAT
jgi:hypothetical protein